MKSVQKSCSGYYEFTNFFLILDYSHLKSTRKCWVGTRTNNNYRIIPKVCKPGITQCVSEANGDSGFGCK